SEWRCKVVSDDTVRLGFCVVNGLRTEHGERLVEERSIAPFQSLDDLKRRVGFTKEELRTVAEVGALNCFAGGRPEAMWGVGGAMWRVEETVHDDLLGSARAPRAVSGALAGNFLGSENLSDACCTFGEGAECCTRGACAPQSLPLKRMTLPERVKADYDAMNL